MDIVIVVSVRLPTVF